ncbi:MAG: N-acetylmuramoyl-L-alanine amidase [Paludibacteraceae bacterium]
MKLLIRPRLFILFFFVLSLQASILYAQKPFTVVLDAGHGGHDSGAVGKFSKEKNINLAVVLELGKLIEGMSPNVKVIYTRKTDVFIPLQRRADIANENHADIFLSIHTNATRSTSIHGTETFLLGLTKSKSNLEVAMKENAVMTLEDDYKTKYQGFDPNSIDSYIMFDYMQDRYLDKSLQLATMIESQFKKSDRYSRGVKQAGFWVLHKSACPSALVELGFISNPAEEKYLNSESGKSRLSKAIFNAVEVYKKEHDRKSEVNTDELESKTDSKVNIVQDQQNAPNEIIFKIQLFALKKKLPLNDKAFKGLKDVTFYREGSFYKYTYGETPSFNSIESTRKTIENKFPEAYVIAFRGDKKIPIDKAK